MRFVIKTASILYLIAANQSSEPTYCLAFQPKTAKLHLEPEELDHDQDGHAAGKLDGGRKLDTVGGLY